jgi:transcriptional regulator with XRE-family HTH domain
MDKPENFYRRLKKICDDSPMVPPYGHGRQVHLASKLKVSQEAVRKWFTGDARPRTDKMRALAKLLEVDEAWLSLGITPEMDRVEKRQHSSRVEGSVYLLFGMFTLAGGHCAFPGEKDTRKEYVDFYAIVQGTQMAVHTSVGRTISKNRWEFIVPHEWKDVRCIGVVPMPGMKFHVLDLDARLLEEHITRKGGDFAVLIDYIDNDYSSGADPWPRIKHIGDL